MSSMTDRASHPPVPFDPQWRSVLESSSLEVFQMMTGATLKAELAADGEPQGNETAMVGMAGALCGMTSIRCTTSAATKLASLLLGGDAVTNPALISDALGELCNMLAGNFKAKINTLADHCMLSVPTVISGSDYSMRTSEPTEGVRVLLNYEGELIWVVLTIHT